MLNNAFAVTLTSSDRQVQFIELYTSEGCSSCPAADRWIASLQHDNGLWSEFVPVAFHVDYWDYLGWEDKFAKEAFSDRQHLHRTQGNISRVYTPGFVIQGQEWHGFFQHKARPSQPDRTVGKLTLELENDLASLTFFPTNALKTADFNIALLGFGLKHTISGGENAGALLEHDFVVLDHQISQADNDDTKLSKTFELNHDLTAQSNRTAVVAWVTPVNQLNAIQAVGGWYPDRSRIATLVE